MKIKDLTESNKSELKQLLDSFYSKYINVFAVTVCTGDGFSLASIMEESIQDSRLLEADKISAMSSTMCSLSSAASNHVLDSKLQNTTIEAEDGSNIILMNVQFKQLDCVIFVSATKKVSLAELRYISKQLATSIQEIT